MFRRDELRISHSLNHGWEASRKFETTVWKP